MRALRRALRAWRLRRARVPWQRWQAATAGLCALHGLDDAAQQRLRELASLFLQEKRISGAGGFVVDEVMRTEIAALACLPILELGLDWYDDWHEVLVYPDTFLVEHETMDETGVVHRVRRPLAGEAWAAGPVILSWADWQHERHGHRGRNVLLHEFVHKLDMRNGATNGMPPLHPDMDRRQWTRTFEAAWRRLQQTLDDGRMPWIDPYAASDPGEFFAVCGELFFEVPHHLRRFEPGVYAQMQGFFRQDPAARLPDRACLP